MNTAAQGKTVYRAESGYRHDPHTTIADVVQHEINDLDNADIGVMDSVLTQLALCPASSCLWVSTNRPYAESFAAPGQPVDAYTLSPYIPIAFDAEGGVLVYVGLQRQYLLPCVLIDEDDPR